MPHELNGSFILAASLGKILERRDIEQSVKDAEEVLREYARYADETAHQLRTRKESDFLKERLEYDDLIKGLYMYNGERRDTKRGRLITFQRKDNRRMVEFWFVRAAYNLERAIDDIAKSGRNYDSQAIENIGKAILRSAISGGEEFSHHSEAVLGKDSRTLDPYKLKEAAVITPHDRVIFGIIPWFSKMEREVIYEAVSRNVR
ncbi:MAG TPA: hypothetical protein VJK03_05435 [Candidatus Nanoarchaeia archaeon]|nr:hypothetical protein [Candidatus Nanoarchaeia archaeon]